MLLVNPVFAIFLLADRVTAVSDYRGGSNPLLTILALIGIFIVVVTVVICFVMAAVKRSRFRKMLLDSTFTMKERGVISSYVERLSVQNPLEIFEDRRAFDGLVDSISHIHDATNASFLSIQEESKLFKEIRRKLKFTYIFKDKKIITSSRAIPLGCRLSVTIHNPVDKKRLMYSYNAEVLENEDFYLAISPPNEFKVEDIRTGIQRLEADVSFARKQDGQYFFLSEILRVVYDPEHMIVLGHKQKLTRTPLMRPLNLPAKMMHSTIDSKGASQVNEYDIPLGTVSNTQTIFLGNDLPIKLNKKDVVVISFEIKGKELSCRGLIAEVFCVKDKIIYQVNFVGLDEETNQFLIHFQMQQRTKLLTMQTAGKA